jgi:ribosomal protein L33
MRDKIKPVSSAGTGTFYTTTKNLGESRPDA